MRPADLTELERATGLVIELDHDAPELPPAPRGMTARAAFAEPIRSALQRPPCLVSFSGGRDSSAVLAVAADIARKERLPAPVPITYVYPEEMARANEASWQERIVGHVGVEDWIRVEITDEMDCLGPIGIDTLRRHAIVYPIAAHGLVPALRSARGGSLLTGMGGDQILGGRSRIADLLARREKPVPRDALRIAAALGPRSIRQARWRGRTPAFVNWLTPAGRAAFERSWGEVLAGIPVAWGKGVRQTWRSRDLRLSLAAMDVLAQEYDVRLVHPLFSPLFISVLASQGGVRGYAGRTAVMQMLFGDVLTDEINGRRTKASFGEPYWRHYSRAFGRAWNGEGVNPELVDVDALRGAWIGMSPPPAPTLVLLKQAWLATNGVAHTVESASTRRPPALAS